MHRLCLSSKHTLSQNGGIVKKKIHEMAGRNFSESLAIIVLILYNIVRMT